MGITLYRVQDSQGQGPYAPGVSSMWMDVGHNERNPDIFQQFRMSVVERLWRKMFRGCAFRTIEQAQRWFSPAEMRRMHELGYRFVRLTADRIFVASDEQVIFGRKTPMADGVEQMDWPW